MSVKHMAWVWEHSRAEGGALLVALALADSVNQLNDSDECWPRIERLASMVRLQPRQITRALRELEALGEVATKRTQRGNIYRLLMPNTPTSGSVTEDHRTNCPVVVEDHSQPSPETTLNQSPMSDPYVEPEKEPEIEPEAIDQLFAAPSETDIQVAQVWDYYCQTVPNGSRYILDDRRKRCVKRALQVRSVNECNQAINGLAHSDHHLKGGYMDIKYALGLPSESPDDRIDRMGGQAQSQADVQGTGLTSDERAILGRYGPYLRDMQARPNNEVAQRQGRGALQELKERYGLEPVMNDGKIERWTKCR